MASHTRQLAELLIAAGAAVTVVQVNRPYWPRWIKGVPVLRAFFRLIPYLASLWRAGARMDVFHIMANSGWSWHLYAAPAIWMAYWRGVPVIVNYHGGEAEAFLKRSQHLVRLSMRRSSALVVPSAFLQNVFSRFGMPACIVPNIVDVSKFSPRGMVRSVIPHLFVARNLERLYDNETAIRAFKTIRQNYPKALLTIAGSGPDEARLRIFVRDHALVGSVIFSGRLDQNEMVSAYRDADILLNPSLVDNMPLSVLEAWACGVPVVSTNVGGISFFVKDGVTASLVSPGDSAAMAQACLLLLSDDATWCQRAQAGIQEVQRYTWPCVQPVLTDLYCQVIGLPRRDSSETV